MKIKKRRRMRSIKSKNTLSLLLGLFLVFACYWGIFVFIRPTRDVPFQLNILRVITLIWIVGLYSFLLYNFFKTSSGTKIAIPKIVLQLVAIIQESLSNVDKNIKYPFNKYYEKVFCYITNKITLTNELFWARVLFTFTLLPRLVLITTLFLDIFYFHQLYYFFKILWIVLIMFIPLYVLYCFRDVSEHIIDYLEKNLEYISTDYVYGVLPPKKITGMMLIYKRKMRNRLIQCI